MLQMLMTPSSETQMSSGMDPNGPTYVAIVEADCCCGSRGPRDDAIKEAHVAHPAHRAQAGRFGRLSAARRLLGSRQVWRRCA